MPLSRSHLSDRRRRVMREAVATDSEFAVESVRAKRRTRSSQGDDADDLDAGYTGYRDPGYSQTVRRTCQQRLVQLIPVRRSSLSLAIGCMWLLWAGLVLSHYIVHVRAVPATKADVSATSQEASKKLLARFASATQSKTSIGRTGDNGVAATSNTNKNAAASTSVPLRALPIGQLFHLRSSHSIAMWLTGQLWMFTALAAWMIYQLRKHKLDDYRAKYRIWIALAIAAMFSSFDASTSSLYLFGTSINDWSRREIGYGGWPLVLATFASIIGIIGIRLCSELKAAPASVGLWIFGLLVWAFSALLGTGLIRTELQADRIDLIVGASWLGGILAVFQSAGIYLRHTYIHAQRRFLQRSGTNLNPIRMSLPKMSLRRKDRDALDAERDGDSSESARRKWKMPWKRNRDVLADSDRHNDGEKHGDRNKHSDNKSRANEDRRSRDDRYEDDDSRSDERRSDAKRSNDRSVDEDRRSDESNSPKRKSRLFGFIPTRTELNERLDQEPIAEVDGLPEDRGFTKARGWFGIGGNRPKDSDDPEKVVRKRSEKSSNENDDDSEQADGTKSRRPSLKSFWKRKPSTTIDGREDKSSSSKRSDSSTDQSSETGTGKSAKKSWMPNLLSKRSQKVQSASHGHSDDGEVSVGHTSTVKSQTSNHGKPQRGDSGDNTGTDGGSKTKSSWFKVPKLPQRKPKAEKDGTEKEAKPKPVKEPRSKDDKSSRGLFGFLDGLRLKPPTEANGDDRASSGQKPVPVQKNASIPSTNSSDGDDDDENDSDGRPLSKAERRRLRRMQQDDRRAA